jgi:hypothetical protein
LLESFLVSPLLSLFLLAVLAIEAITLAVLWRKWGIGLPLLQILSFLGSGAAFAGALGFALAGENPVAIGICLSLAFVCHLADLILRWERRS